MSRTVTTDPFHARAHVWRAHHDHSNGTCDLPSLDAFLRAERGGVRARTACRWDVDWWAVRDTRCSCDLCSDRTGRRNQARSERQRTRVALRQGRYDD